VATVSNQPEHIRTPSLREQPALPTQLASDVAEGLVGGYHGLRAQTYGGLQAAGAATGIDTLEAYGQQGYDEAMQQASEYQAPVQRIEDIRTAEDALRWAAYRGAELIPSAASMVAGGGIGGGLAGALRLPAAAGAAAGAYTSSALPQVGGIYRETLDEGGVDAPVPAIVGGLAGAGVEMLPIARGIRRAVGGRGLARNALTSMGEESLAEGTQEGIAVGTRAYSDPNFRPDVGEVTSRVGNAAAVGALGGAGFGAASTGIQAFRERTAADRANPVVADGLPARSYGETALDEAGALDENGDYNPDAVFADDEFQSVRAPQYDYTDTELSGPARAAVGLEPLDPAEREQLGLRPNKSATLAERLAALNEQATFGQDEQDTRKRAVREQLRSAYRTIRDSDAFDEGGFLDVPAEGLDPRHPLVQADITPGVAERLFGTPGRKHRADLLQDLGNAAERLGALDTSGFQPYEMVTLRDQAEEEALQQFPDDAEARRQYVRAKGEQLYTDRSGLADNERLAELYNKQDRYQPGDEEYIRLGQEIADADKRLSAKLGRYPAGLETLYDRRAPEEFLSQYNTIRTRRADQERDYSLGGRLGKGADKTQALKQTTSKYAPTEYEYQLPGQDVVLNFPNLIQEVRRQRAINGEAHSLDTPLLEQVRQDLAIGLDMVAQQSGAKDFSKVPDDTVMVAPRSGAKPVTWGDVKQTTGFRGPWRPTKIISGGQTGADVGGLVAAKRAGLQTGGTAPKGYRTEKGAQLALRDEFGLGEDTSTGYEARTRRNVEDADATIIIGEKLGSPGSKQTAKIARKLGRPALMVKASDPKAVSKIKKFLAEYKPKTLNIAGNRDSVAPGLAAKVAEVLHDAIGDGPPKPRSYEGPWEMPDKEQGLEFDLDAPAKDDGAGYKHPGGGATVDTTATGSLPRLESGKYTPPTAKERREAADVQARAQTARFRRYDKQIQALEKELASLTERAGKLKAGEVASDMSGVLETETAEQVKTLQALRDKWVDADPAERKRLEKTSKLVREQFAELVDFIKAPPTSESTQKLLELLRERFKAVRDELREVRTVSQAEGKARAKAYREARLPVALVTDDEFDSMLETGKLTLKYPRSFKPGADLRVQARDGRSEIATRVGKTSEATPKREPSAPKATAVPKTPTPQTAEQRAVAKAQARARTKTKKAKRPSEDALEAAKAKREGAADRITAARREATLGAEVGLELAKLIAPSMTFTQVPLKQLNAATQPRLRAQLNKVVRRLKLPANVELLTTKQAMKRVPPDWRGQIVDGRLHGFTTPLKRGRIAVYVNPQYDAETQSEILNHELGHVVFRTMGSTLDTKTALRIVNQYHRWLHKYRSGSVQRLIESRKTPQAQVLYLLNNIGTRPVETLSKGEREYLTNFEEWFADEVSRWLEPGRRVPRTGIQRFFHAIAQAMRGLYRMVTPRQGSVDSFLSSVAGGRRSWGAPVSPSEVFKAVVDSRIGGGDKARLRKVLGPQWADRMAASAMLAYSPGLAPKFDRFFEGSGVEASGVNTLRRAVMTPAVQRQLHELVPAEDVSNPDDAMIVAYRLWHRGAIKLNPAARGVLQRMIQGAEDTLGIIRDTDTAEDIFQAMSDGVNAATAIEQGTYLPERYMPDSVAAKAVDTLGPAFKSMTKPLGKLFQPMHERLWDTEIPALREVATRTHRRAGQVGAGESLWDLKRKWRGKWQNVERSIFEGVSKEDTAAVLELLYGAKPDANTTAKHKNLVARTHKMMRAMLKYQRDAGVEVGDIGKDYFPWVLDMEVMEGELAEFTLAVGQEKYEKDRVGIAITNNLPIFTKHFEGELRAAQQQDAERPLGGSGVNAKRVREEMDPKTAARTYAETGELLPALRDATIKNAERLLTHEEVPGRIYDNAMASAGYADVDPTLDDEVDHVPNARFINHRVLNFMEYDDIRPFLSDDLGATLESYIASSVKHAEYTRAYGRKGIWFENKMLDAKAQGASTEQIQLARDYLNATMGVHGLETAKRLNKTFGLALPKPWSPINENLNTTFGGFTLFQNLRLLPLATLTSLADPLSIAVRGGDFKTLFDGISGWAKSLRTDVDGKSELTHLAEMLGLIEHADIVEAVGFQYDGAYMTGKQAKWNDKFFTFIGLEQLTKHTRLMALAAGQSFLKRHALSPNKHSKRYLAELGLRPGDIQADDALGLGIKVLTRAQRDAKPGEDELARDDRVRAALSQFVDEAILRPNPSMRALWMNDPHFQLLAYLKSFIYAFHDRVIKRAWHEAMNENWTSFAALLSYIPAMLIIGMLRELIQYGGDDPGWQAGWGMGEHMSYAADRGGLGGIYQEPIEAAVNLDPFEFVSPLAGVVSKVPDLLMMDAEAWRDLLPFAVVHDKYVE
jgi:hypothetical protein